MNTLKYWGTLHKVRAGDRSLGVYGSRGSHVVRKNLSSQQSAQSISVRTGNEATQSTPSSLTTGLSTFGKMKKSSSSSALHQSFPAHQTITPLLTTNLTIGMLSSRSFTSPSSPSLASNPSGTGSGGSVVRVVASTGIAETKADLAKVVDEQIDEIKQTEDMSIHRDIAKKFLKESHFKVREDVPNNLGIVYFSDNNHSVEVTFPLVEDETFDDLDEDVENEGSFDFDDPKRKSDKLVDESGIDVGPVRSGKHLPEPWPKKHALAINILFHDKEGKVKGRWQLTGFAGEDNRLYVEEMRVLMSDARKDAEGNDPIDSIHPTLFDELNNDLQDRIYDFLDDLSVDDRMAHFVKAYSVQYKNSVDVGFLQNLKSLISEGLEEQTKTKQSTPQQKKKVAN